MSQFSYELQWRRATDRHDDVDKRIIVMALSHTDTHSDVSEGGAKLRYEI